MPGLDPRIHLFGDDGFPGQARQMTPRIEAFEMAFKMQTEATDAFDLNKESESTRAMYGRSQQGNQMLIARRLL